ncbi:alpha-L-fucosidase [Granulicella sp. 5B5]|uniref:alpha-L-fucosidase n=1 Tax=Granulicella sp. 5B5 TaxID=1617967 RepID=UPI0015F58156|nr:alpha-L-fucosidase [Granulicella sp. 5B5]QMV17947.1 alpha-L-fucosidase [Granulicella sp. 5B5]
MKRRGFLYGVAAGVVASRAGAWTGALGEYKGVVRALPSAKERAWQDLEVGMFVHFAPNTWQDVESDNLSTPLSEIDPKNLSTDQWAQTAVALGARYIVFVAKHQGGFCMWQTKTTEYSIRNTPWKDGKGDVLREVEASCRKYGLKLGVYVCPRDDHFGAGTGGVCKTLELQAKYDAMYREQLTEVFTRYGELVEIWFDGSTVTPVGDLLAKYQPGAMVFQGPQATIRWVGNEDGFAPYPCWNGIDAAEAKSGTATALDSDPNGSVWLPSEVDVSIRRPNWFWSTKNANKVLTLDQLMSIYYRSVGRGAQLLLNIPANREGLLSDPDCRVAAAFGAEVKRRFGSPVGMRSGKGESIELKLAKPMRIDTVVLQEEIALGERVRGYRLEARTGGSWKEIGAGSAIGHKRIQPVESQVVDAVRLVVTEAAAAPMIRTLAVFDTVVAPPADWDAVSSLWSANLVGKWAAGSFSLDLTKAVHAATEYLLRFHPVAGAVTGLRDVMLQIGEASNPALVKRVPGRSDELLLDITGLDKTIRVSGKVEGAESGSVTLERR